jgi:hypothetical protein
MTLYRLVAFTNPEPGRDREFNEWYDKQHIPDVLRLPGFTAAQRFKLCEQQQAAARPEYQYLTIYEIDTQDITSVMQALSRTVGTEAMPLSGALAQPRLSYLFEPLTGKQFASSTRQSA